MFNLSYSYSRDALLYMAYYESLFNDVFNGSSPPEENATKPARLYDRTY